MIVVNTRVTRAYDSVAGHLQMVIWGLLVVGMATCLVGLTQHRAMRELAIKTDQRLVESSSADENLSLVVTAKEALLDVREESAAKVLRGGSIAVLSLVLLSNASQLLIARLPTGRRSTSSSRATSHASCTASSGRQRTRPGRDQRLPNVRLIAALVLFVVALLRRRAFAYDPASRLEVAVEGDAAGEPAGDTLELLSWNVGYGALGSDSGFVADGGRHLRPRSRATVERNLDAIVRCSPRGRTPSSCRRSRAPPGSRTESTSSTASRGRSPATRTRSRRP